MDLGEPQKRTLGEIGEQILAALEAVARAAQSQLSARSTDALGDVLATHPSLMAGGLSGVRNVAALRSEVRQHLERLLREPFVARVVVRWQDTEPQCVLYIARASVAGLRDAIGGAELATYMAPIGRLAEFEAGDSTTIVVGGREREARILERVRLHPEQREGSWDGLDGDFELLQWHVFLESVRRFIDEVQHPPLADRDLDVLGRLLEEAAAHELVRKTARRKVIDRMALRDQPILDRFQGEIFRMPLDRRMMLFGPPGSGKTTTLIRRLAQKRTPEALTADEERMLTGDLRETFLRQDSWVMFSPTELLKLYLRDAFNREGVPAADASNLRTWEKERLELGRNVLQILRSADSGRFQLDDRVELLMDTSSPALSVLHDEVADYVHESVLAQCNAAFDALQRSHDDAVKIGVADLRRRLGVEGQLSLREVLALLDRASALQPDLKRLNTRIDNELRRLVNELLRNHAGVLDEVVAILPTLLGEEGDDEDDEEEEDETDDSAESRLTGERRFRAARLLMSVIRRIARSAAEGRVRVGGRSGRLVELLGSRAPTKEQLARLGTDLGTRTRLRTIIQAPRALVLGVPRLYARFRRQAIREGRHFRADAADAVKRNRISPDETDILVLVMLRNARRLLEHEGGTGLGSAGQPEWLESIKRRYVMQVFVDEATDLSAVQLACTLELTHPTLRSWFACGDLGDVPTPVELTG